MDDEVKQIYGLRAGRPAIRKGMRQKHRGIALDDAAAAMLKAFGHGNLSAGARRAAALIERWKLWEKSIDELGV